MSTPVYMLSHSDVMVERTRFGRRGSTPMRPHSTKIGAQAKIWKRTVVAVARHGLANKSAAMGRGLRLYEKP